MAKGARVGSKVATRLPSTGLKGAKGANQKGNGAAFAAFAAFDTWESGATLTAPIETPAVAALAEWGRKACSIPPCAL
jgi:hypothetical protein